MEVQQIQSKIFEIRGHRVMIDRDLAEIYGVETRVLNQAVKRNSERFPEDFMFQLPEQEWAIMSSQIVMTSKSKRPKSAVLSLHRCFFNNQTELITFVGKCKKQI